MVVKDKLINYFGKNIKKILKDVDLTYFEKAEEIRIRLGKSIIFKNFNEEYFILKNGQTTKTFLNQQIYIPTEEDIAQTIETMGDYSIYALEQEIKNGFLTLKGGFRIGITGKAIVEEGKIKTVRNISSINIRIAKEVKGCSHKILKYITEPNINSTLIISPPNCGKTTLLRDIIKNISDNGQNVSIVDERSEIASVHKGICQLDVGQRTDVLDRCPKYDGMLMVLRSMSPNIIAVDEIGDEKDIDAIEKIANSGVNIICTIHSFNIKDLKQKHNLKNILDKKIFKRYIVLNRKNGVCNVDKIYDENFKNIYGE